MAIETQTAPQTFNKTGYVYHLVNKEGKRTIYSQAHLETPDVIKGYEVHLIRYRKGMAPFKGNLVGRTERLASNEDFGKWGWSFSKYEWALAKFDEIKSRGDGR